MAMSVNYDTSYEDILKRLCFQQGEKDNKEQKMFATQWQLMVFLANLASKLDKPKKFSKKSKKAVLVDSDVIPNNCEDLIFIFAVSKFDATILDNKKKENEIKIYKSYEEYVNGGFEILRNWLKDQSINAENIIIDKFIEHKIVPEVDKNSDATEPNW